MTWKPDEPPREFSISDSAEAAQWRDWGSPRIRITLDGVEQDGVVGYSVDHGWVNKQVRDADGLPKLTRGGDAVQLELVKGEVTAEWME